MKQVIILLITCLVSGCIYDSEGKCFRAILETVSASHCKGYSGKQFPYVAMYQKESTLGHTNSEQRWKDIIDCGGKYGDWNMEYYPTDYKIKGKSYKHHGECMADKGYIHLYPAQCGFMDPKRDKGKCNL